MDGEEEKGGGGGGSMTQETVRHVERLSYGECGLRIEVKGYCCLGKFTLFDKMMSYPIALHPHRHL